MITDIEMKNFINLLLKEAKKEKNKEKYEFAKRLNLIFLRSNLPTWEEILKEKN